MSKTQNNIELVGYYGSDESHALSAWTSTSRELSEEKRGRMGKLLTMLAQDNHHTPFEKSTLHFLVNCETASHIHIIKHRVGLCLAEGTQVWCEYYWGDAPEGRTHRCVRKRPIEELWHNWHIGVLDKPHRRTGRHKGLTEEIKGRVRRLPSCRSISTRTLNEDTGIFQLGPIVDTHRNGVKDIYEVCVGKHVLRCSADHKVLTSRGWARVKDLGRLDEIAISGIVSTSKGPKVPQYLRTGIGIWTQRQRPKLIRDIDFCHGCNGEFPFDSLQLDHIIPVKDDLEKALCVSNLRPLCEKCHREKTNTEQCTENNRTDCGLRFKPLLKKPSLVGEAETYDLTIGGDFPNFVANGIVVHNSVNGESARYKELKGDKYHIPRDWPIGERERLEQHVLNSFEEYHACLARLIAGGMDRKRAKESARFYLPYANSLTLDTSFNFRSFMHFQRLRNDDHAQLEIREIAQEMLRLVRSTGQFDLSLKAFGYG